MICVCIIGKFYNIRYWLCIDFVGYCSVVIGVLYEDFEDLGDDLGEVDFEFCF